MKTKFSLTLAVMALATVAFAKIQPSAAMPANQLKGEYTFEVNDAGRKVEKASQKEDSVTSIVSVKRLTNEPAKYLITTKGENINMITVSVFNADGILLRNDSHLVDGSFTMVYDLVKEGGYTFTVSDDMGESRTFQF